MPFVKINLAQNFTEKVKKDIYMNVPHSANMVYVEITASAGRTVAMKKALYRSIAEKIAARTPIAIDDVFIVLTETTLENWLFGQGVAQMI
ncbi:MAG TPA: tautomerase family protein [Chitinophaga sp.]|uniref:tautomerase family protein n=1 Tax=Chitinophaga sp. TaxID=1869181 RepID=UPI002DB932D7|nr:tautomerase family protein [Chitinophaga sp.]HEU4552396.1 tautomerase family protein [Chitinophaga sp.]